MQVTITRPNIHYQAFHLAHSWRAGNLNWPIRIQQAGKILLSWGQCNSTGKALKQFLSLDPPLNIREKEFRIPQTIFFLFTVQYVYSHYLQLNNSCLPYLHYNSILTRTLLLNTTTYYIHTTITTEYHCHYFNSIKIHHTIQY